MAIRKILTVVVLVLFTVSLAGCATNGYYDPARSAGAGALGGAATGAALGAIIGAATGSPATGAWVGAAAGAVVGGVGGYLYAEHQNNQTRSAAMAAQSYHYTPARGDMVDISEVDASPNTLRRGQTINLVMTYTILTPEDAMVPVNLYREIRRDGVAVGSPYQGSASNRNGSYVDRVGLTIPSDAAPGRYTVINRIMTPRGTAERVTYFTVI